MYFRRLIAARRRAGSEDLITALIEASVEGKRLTEEEIISFCFVLLRAGHITTSSLLSQALRCFAEHPAVLAHLRMHPEDLPSAIEEVLRYASPIWRLPRTTTEAVTIHTVTTPQGARVFAWLASANRDEEHFLNPERFEIARSPNKHIAFGHGIHLCVGAVLARLEASIALPILLQQIPDFHIYHKGPVELSGEFGPFDFRHFAVTFTPSASSGVGN